MSEDRNGWYGLLAILQAGRDEARTRATQRPLACPNDGEPYKTGRRGQLYCPFDGYRPGGAR